MSHTNSTSHYSLPQFVGTDIPTWLGDFNSAMTAIDNGINSAATSASGAATTAAQALTDAAAAASSATSAYNAAAAAQKAADDAANRCPFPIGFGGFFQTDPSTIYSGTTWAPKKDVFILAAGDIYGAGSTGGEAQHTLIVDEMPKHRHSSDSYQDGYAQNPVQSDKYITWVNNFIGNSRVNDPQTGEEGDVLTSQVGGSQPHNNMPPYFAMPFWVRMA